MENEQAGWGICNECKGQGKKSRGLGRKARLTYQAALDQYEKQQGQGTAPVKPKSHLHVCTDCSGSGLIACSGFPAPDAEAYPHIAIIGAGIGGVALAVACLHRGIPFTIYERDTNFNARSQGYGLTLQQASKAIEAFGIFSLADGVTSTRHVVHTTDGKIIGEWGLRKWMDLYDKAYAKRTNVHIARQSLRLALLAQLGGHNVIQWGHQLTVIEKCTDGNVALIFNVNGEVKNAKAGIVVGADGIRSTVRKLVIGEDSMPLRYLDCIVILGICPLSALKGVNSPLLDSATVFQTVNGKERIYMMPYTSDSIMWQLSFPMTEENARALSAKGPQALKDEACRRTQWHDPIPQILAATHEAQISGYPVYDRDLLKPELLQNAGEITLIGDAAHPMSPFKGQGANQALLDALLLARTITKECRHAAWRNNGVRESILNKFEAEMLQRSASKVKGSAEAAQFLHSEVVLYEGDMPRGHCIKNKDT